MPGTGAWAVIATNETDTVPFADLRAAGPFDSEADAVAFAGQIEYDGTIDWRVTQLYEPERGPELFAIGDR